MLQSKVLRADSSLYLAGNLYRSLKYILFSKAKKLNDILHNTQNMTLFPSLICIALNFVKSNKTMLNNKDIFIITLKALKSETKQLYLTSNSLPLKFAEKNLPLGMQGSDSGFQL